ncbi:MAG: DUF2179 domain-containing protein [Deltaproteobacteria bacterium]|nr:DUF2179 domain-containing protein [Deltaproteobacteria bacterium]
MILEAKLSLGLVAVRVITRKGAEELINHLRWEGYGVTDVPAHGAQGDVHVIFTIVQRSDLQKVVKAVKEYNPNAFYSVEDIREISHGVVPKRTPPAFSRKALRLFRFQRKGK